MDEIDTQMSKMDKSDQYSKIILKNIKHDLINPINAMIGYSELILDELEDMKEVVFDNDIVSQAPMVAKPRSCSRCTTTASGHQSRC